MAEAITSSNQTIVLDRERALRLERKAIFLDKLLSFMEDLSLGSLMQETEEEENISLLDAKQILKKTDGSFLQK